MSHTRLLIPALLLAASLATVAVGAADDRKSSDDRGVMSVIAQAPLKTRDWKNPYEGNPDAITAGKRLYLQHCAECHGQDARGMHNAANLRSPGVQNATPGELVWFLRNGNLWHGMPSWSGLPDQRRWQIVTYLKTLGPHTNSGSERKAAAGSSAGGEQ
jgi:mono/diheme cytochrome c family protein